MRNFFLCALLAAGLPLLLSACGGTNVRKELGLERNAPDEFAVVKRAPLEMPPGYGLPPPRPGTPRPQEQAATVRARQTVFGTRIYQKTPTSSRGEDLLLYQAGGSTADPAIRTKVDRETAALGDTNVPVAKKILNIGSARRDPPATIVDAAEEARRLRENAERGVPVTEGETPSIEE